MASPRPDIFISATSGDLRSCRQLIKNALLTLGCHPVEQDTFPPAATAVRDMLRQRISACRAVVHIVGLQYGAEPQTRDPSQPRRSYTQLEYDIARELNKPVYVFICGDQFPYDPPPAGAMPEDETRRELQRAHRQILLQGDHLYTPVGSVDELQLRVRELDDHIRSLAQELQQERRRGRLVLGACAALLLLVTAVGLIVYRTSQKTLQTTQTALAEARQNNVFAPDKARAQLIAASQRKLDADLADVEQVRDWQARDRKRKGANEAHAQRLGRIDALVAEMDRLQSADTASPVLRELTRVLGEQGVDAALAYLEAQRAEILAGTRSDLERLRERLQPLLTGADAAAAAGQADRAESLYRDAIKADPGWPQARRAFVQFLLFQKGPRAEIYEPLRTARDIYEEALRHVTRLTEDAPDFNDDTSALSSCHLKLCDVLVNLGDLKSADAACARVLELRLRLAQARPTDPQARRDLSVAYERVGSIRLNQGRLADAATAYTQALDLVSQLAAADPADAWSKRQVSVNCEKLGAVRYFQGDFNAAATAYARNLNLRLELAQAAPTNAQAQRDLAIAYSRIGDLRSAQGNLPEATNAYGNGLPIFLRLAKAEPANRQAQRDLWTSYINLGNAHVTREDYPAAAAAITNAMEIARRLVEADAASALAQRDLAITYNYLGNLRSAQEDLAGAATAYESNRVLCLRLAEADPTSAQAQRDLGVSHEKVAVVRGTQGDLAAASGAFTNCLTIRLRLAQADPSNAQAQRDVWVTHYQIAEMLERNKSAEATAHYRTARDLIRGMKEKGLFVSPDDLKVLDDLDAKLR